MERTTAARIVGGISALVGLLAIAWAFGAIGDVSTPAEVPDYALGSSMVLRAEWALALVLAVTIPAVFIARLLDGHFPSRISAQGTEWPAVAPDLIASLDGLQQNVNDLSDVVTTLVDAQAANVDALNELDIRLQAIEP